MVAVARKYRNRRRSDCLEAAQHESRDDHDDDHREDDRPGSFSRRGGWRNASTALIRGLRVK
jgi:hypothetical protein